MRTCHLCEFGWSPEMAGKLINPTLVVVGEFDRLSERKTVYDQLGSSQKVFTRVACASHFMVWEKQPEVLRRLSHEWLENGTALGQTSGELNADKDGKVSSIGQ